MNEYIYFLMQTQLFKGFEPNAIIPVLKQLGAEIKTYKKNETILSEKDCLAIGLILFGAAQIARDNYAGETVIISEITGGQVITETLASENMSHNPIRLKATEESKVLLLNYEKIMSLECEYEDCKSQLLINLMNIFAKKNQLLSANIGYLSGRSIRNKVLSYLYDQAKIVNNTSFFIPYNRQEMADFLRIDRCALSNELRRLQNDNILSFHKNHFILS